MNEQILDLICERLWQAFLPSIKSGNQLFFCFNRTLIRHLFNDVFPQDTLESFFKFASSYIVVANDKCYFEKEIFDQRGIAKTRVILLVAQQILVVEDMVNENGITQEAYFPRLRRRISDELYQVSEIPFEPEDFLRLWETFREEVIAEGASPASITFSGGIGRDTYRLYPISQALFSSQDLVRLVVKFPENLPVGKISDVSLYDLIKKNKFALSSRGRRVFAVSWLRVRVLNQVRSFYSSYKSTDNVIIRRPARIEELALRIYDGGIFGNGYDIVGLNKAGEPASDSITSNYLLGQLEESVGLFFYINQDSLDYWELNDGVVTLKEGDSLIILTVKENQIRSVLDSFWPGSFSLLEKVELNVGVFGYRFKIPHNFSRPCGLAKGSLRELSSKDVMEWKGGICVDKRSNSYLLGYAPTQLVIGDISLRSNYLIRVAGMTYELDVFLRELHSLKTDHSFVVALDDNKSINLNVKTQRSVGNFSEYGYPYDSNRFSCVPEEVFPETIVLKGFQFNGKMLPDYKITQRQILSILEMNFVSWEILDEDKIEIILNSIETSDFPKPVKAMAKSLVRRNKTCPSGLADDLLPLT